jgi:hypothetical protein
LKNTVGAVVRDGRDLEEVRPDMDNADDD